MTFSKVTLFSISFGVLLLSACNSSKAPDFPRSWRPLNELPEQVTEIPLTKQHFYQTTQLDTTVKGLLERWGEEARMPVVYDSPSDFTLYRKVKEIKHVDLNSALAELTDLYAEQEMVFYVQNNVIMAHKRIGVAVKTGLKKSK